MKAFLRQRSWRNWKYDMLNHLQIIQLVDGLLWSSYPETVSILSNHQREKEFAKVNHWSLLGSTYYMLINLVNVIGFYDHAADYWNFIWFTAPIQKVRSKRKSTLLQWISYEMLAALPKSFQVWEFRPKNWWTISSPLYFIWVIASSWNWQ